MKHFVRILSFLTLGLASCAGCNKKDNTVPVCTGNDCNVTSSTPDADLPPVVLNSDAGVSTSEPLDLPPQKFAGSDWEFSTPSGWGPVSIDDEGLKPEILIANMEEHNLILLTKEPTRLSTAEFAAALAQGFHEDEVTVTSTTQVELNGKQFLVLDTNKEDSHMWFWVFVQNNVAYSLSCGGPLDEDHHEGICKEVANSLIIK